MNRALPGFYSIRVGRYKVTALADGVNYIANPEGVFTQTTSTAVDAALTRSFLPTPYPASVNSFLVKTPNTLVLIDTGAGALMTNTLGLTLEHLRASGHEPNEVSDIYLTHLHEDHEGGLVSGGRKVFPNATVRANAKDVEFWLTSSDAKSAVKQTAPSNDPEKAFVTANFKGTEQMLTPYVDSGRLQSFNDGEELTEGIRAVAAPGLTPGHTTFSVESEGEKLLVWGDLIHFADFQLASLEVGVVFDSDRELAATERKRVLDEVAADRTLIAGAHVSFPGFGHVRSDGAAYTWVPIAYGDLR